ncbi:MAG: hypothetical protein ACRC0G_07775 [Fusobacteriaceae bacterium]
MLFKEWLDNPTTKKIPGYTLVKEQLKIRYKKMVTEKKKFVINIYKNKGAMLVHVKVPTEGDIPELYYDVLLSVSPSNVLMDSEVEVYSNCPSFTFRFAYVCNSLGLIIPDYIGHYDKEVLTKSPEETNPTKILGYDKSILYALWALEDHGYKSYADIVEDAVIDRSQLDQVMQAEGKKQQAQLLRLKYAENKKKNKNMKTVNLAKAIEDDNMNNAHIKTSSGKIKAGPKISAKKAKGRITGKKKI